MSNNAIAELYENAHNDSAKNDFEIARSNIITLIDNGQESLAQLAQLADQSQNPRAYEVLAKLTDSLLQANRELLELQIKIRTIGKLDEPINGQKTTINNNLILTTADLLKMITSNTKKEIDGDRISE
jgi:hypothetical protein